MRQVSITACIGLAGALLATLAGQANSTEPRPTAVPPSGIGLGWGWQSAREAAIPSICVEFARGEDLAQTAQLTIREVSDRTELMEELGVSASAAVDHLFSERIGVVCQIGRPQADVLDLSASRRDRRRTDFHCAAGDRWTPADRSPSGHHYHAAAANAPGGKVRAHLELAPRPQRKSSAGAR